jgi:hypothetical protein
VLEQAVNEGILDNYDLNGGVALELRFAEGARATKDIDIGVRSWDSGYAAFAFAK